MTSFLLQNGWMVLGYLNTYSLTKCMDGLRLIVSICAMQVIVEKAERSDIPNIDKKKSVLSLLDI